MKVHGCIKNIIQSDFDCSSRLYVVSDAQRTSQNRAGDFFLLTSSVMVGKQIIMRNRGNVEQPSIRQGFRADKGGISSLISFDIKDRTEKYMANMNGP